jgi:hypothetical protein
MLNHTIFCKKHVLCFGCPFKLRYHGNTKNMLCPNGKYRRHAQNSTRHSRLLYYNEIYLESPLGDNIPEGIPVGKITR